MRDLPRTWLVTGAAGFVGSHLVEHLLALGQRVVGLDNFATGRRENVDDTRRCVSPAQAENYHFIEGDIRDLADCRNAMRWQGSSATFPVDFVLHQAALGSVPRSVADPVATNATNVGGFLNVLVAARDAGVSRVVFAASSSTYGDAPGLPKVEHVIGRPLSPYAVTKYVNELYADVFARTYGLQTIGLRYFNVFGPRQDPHGAYAAVVPKWIEGLIESEEIFINGDGETSRDFCFVENAVQANLLAATVEDAYAVNQIYNVAVGEQTSLNRLYELLVGCLKSDYPHVVDRQPTKREFRAGDVRHSLADISKAADLLGYQPAFRIQEGLAKTVQWHVDARASGAKPST